LNDLIASSTVCCSTLLFYSKGVANNYRLSLSYHFKRVVLSNVCKMAVKVYQLDICDYSTGSNYQICCRNGNPLPS